MQISYFSSFFCPVILASIDDSCLWSTLPCYYGIYQMVIFFFFLSPLFFLYYKQELSLLTVWSVTYVSMDSWIFVLIYGLCSITIIFLLTPHLAIKNFFTSDPLSFVSLLCVVFQGIYFLATQDIPDLSCTFDTPGLASVISPQSSGSFY